MIWRVAFEAGDAGDAAAAVGRAARLVQAVDRRPEVGVTGRGSHVEELIGGELAVKDVAADQPVFVLHLERPDHLTVKDRIGEAGRHGVDACDHPVGVGVELVAAVRSRPRVRNPLREHRHHVLAFGRERGVEHGRDADVGERKCCRAPRDGVLERALDLVE